MLVTPTSVAKIVERLHSEGVALDRITVRAVREELGGGSLSTIGEYLRSAKENLTNHEHTLVVGPQVIAAIEARLLEVAAITTHAMRARANRLEVENNRLRLLLQEAEKKIEQLKGLTP